MKQQVVLGLFPPPLTMVAPAVQNAHWKNQLSIVLWQPSEVQETGVITPTQASCWLSRQIMLTPYSSTPVYENIGVVFGPSTSGLIPH